MPYNFSRLDAQSAAEKAVSVIRLGYDLCSDVRLSSCKATSEGSRLLEIDQTKNRDLVFPGGIVVNNVSSRLSVIKANMSEKFNQDMSLPGKIPSGMFNAMFDLSKCWQKDASFVKSLAYDGWFISLYSVELVRSQLTLRDEVKREVPSSWDSVALAGFIEKYGTHIVAGVTMGGKDVIHMKQLRESNQEPNEVQKMLKHLGDRRFCVDTVENVCSNPGKPKEESPLQWGFQPFGTSVSAPVIMRSKNKDIVSICIRRGGVDMGQSHDRWLSTVSQSPNAISMCFVPITTLLSGLPGTGFLSHAVNLYLRYKPPIEELHQFLEFQLPRQWAPVDDVGNCGR